MFVADTEEQVSWTTHVGVILVGVMKRRGVRLSDREIVQPHAVELAEEVSQGPWGCQGRRRIGPGPSPKIFDLAHRFYLVPRKPFQHWRSSISV